MPDKNIVCGDCGTEFVFSERDQEFYKKMQFSDPKRCPACRRVRKQKKNERNYERNYVQEQDFPPSYKQRYASSNRMRDERTYRDRYRSYD